MMTHNDERKRIDDEANETITTAIERRAGKLWLMDKGWPLDNVIYYDHMRTFAFGWLHPLTTDELDRLRDVLIGFPYRFEVIAVGALIGEEPCVAPAPCADDAVAF